MATIPQQDALEMNVSKFTEEDLRMLRELAANADKGIFDEPPHSIMELCGLGEEIWAGIDAQEYIDSERASWNG
jgi:hypothetical protein